MDQLNQIKNGDPQVILQISAEALREIVTEMYNRAEAKAAQAKADRNQVATISRDEAARILNVTSSTLWRWDRDGYLKPVRIGAKVMYRQIDIDRLLTEKGGRV